MYQQLPNGYAKGSETVAYVDRSSGTLRALQAGDVDLPSGADATRVGDG